VSVIVSVVVVKITIRCQCNEKCHVRFISDNGYCQTNISTINKPLSQTFIESLTVCYLKFSIHSLLVLLYHVFRVHEVNQNLHIRAALCKRDTSKSIDWLHTEVHTD
jgi:hypothetical protein